MGTNASTATTCREGRQLLNFTPDVLIKSSGMSPHFFPCPMGNIPFLSPTCHFPRLVSSHIPILEALHIPLLDPPRYLRAGGVLRAPGAWFQAHRGIAGLSLVTSLAGIGLALALQVRQHLLPLHREQSWGARPDERTPDENAYSQICCICHLKAFFSHGIPNASLNATCFHHPRLTVGIHAPPTYPLFGPWPSRHVSILPNLLTVPATWRRPIEHIAAKLSLRVLRDRLQQVIIVWDVRLFTITASSHVPL